METYKNQISFLQAEWYKKKVVEKRNLEVNNFFISKLQNAINFSFTNIPRMDAQFIITLDLRNTNRKRNGLRNIFGTHNFSSIFYAQVMSSI